LNSAVFRWALPLACLLTPGCDDGVRRRPSVELRHGAAAFVPWIRIELEAWRGQGRDWRLPLRNPFDVPVRLEPPELEGCGKCLSAVWQGTVVGEGVTIEPGGETRLLLTYTGQAVGTRGRYRLRFRLGDGGDPCDVAVDVRYRDPRPFSIPNVTLRTERDHAAALTLPWAADRSDPPVSLRATNGAAAVRTVLARNGENQWTLTMVPSAPWGAYQRGVVVVSWPGDRGEWIVPWQCVGVSPVALHWARGAGHRTLRVSSTARRSLPVQVVLMRGDETTHARSLELPPRGVVHLPLDTTGVDRVVVRVADSGAVQSIAVPDS
jgi:hypothetical protein